MLNSLQYTYLTNNIKIEPYQRKTNHFNPFVNCQDILFNNTFIQTLINGYFRIHNSNPRDISNIVYKYLFCDYKSFSLYFRKTVRLPFCDDQGGLVLLKPLIFAGNVSNPDETSNYWNKTLKISFDCTNDKDGDIGTNNFRLGVIGIKKDFDLIKRFFQIFESAAIESKKIENTAKQTDPDGDDIDTTNNKTKINNSLSSGEGLYFENIFKGDKIKLFKESGFEIDQNITGFYLGHHCRSEKRDYEGDFGIGSSLGVLTNNQDFIEKQEDHHHSSNVSEIYDLLDTAKYQPWYHLSHYIKFIMKLDNKKSEISFYIDKLDHAIILEDQYCDILKEICKIDVNNEKITLSNDYYYFPWFDSRGCGFLFDVSIL